MELPEARYADLAGWGTNTSDAGVVAPIVLVRIVARLATHDTRRHNTFTVHGDSWGWRYAWTEWVLQTELIAGDEVKDSQLVAELLDTPLARAGLATGHGLELKFEQRHLGRSVIDRLAPILIAADRRLGEVEVMTRVPRTMDEVIGNSQYSRGRRMTFSAFGVD